MKLYGITPEGTFKEYVRADFQTENREALLEDWLEKNSDNIVENDKLLIIGRQVTTNLGSFIDLLAIDRSGDVAVIELKRNRTPRETLAQALEYASFVENLGYEQLEGIFQIYIGDESVNLAQYHREYFVLTNDEASVFNNDQRLIIVGQKITPEIRQTSSFLQMKGIQVTCIEFTFFRSNDGQHLFSTETIIGEKTDLIKKVSTDSLPPVSKSTFIESLDKFGPRVFERILEFAEQNNYPIRWATKGFSLNINRQGTYVPVCFGYPPTAIGYRQSLYTALLGQGGFLSKVDVPENVVINLGTELKDSGLFRPASKEYKCMIDREFSSQEIDDLIRIGD